MRGERWLMSANDTPTISTAVDRREALKKAAVAAGVVAWTTPAVQVLSGGTAHAQTVTGCNRSMHCVPGGDRR